MPYDQVMSKYKRGTLHSGSMQGPKVTSQKQALAIMMSEQRAAKKGKMEYKAGKHSEHYYGEEMRVGKVPCSVCGKRHRRGHPGG